VHGIDAMLSTRIVYVFINMITGIDISSARIYLVADVCDAWKP
jgi:hypothetical protein